MIVLASPIVDWDAMWKIFVVTFAAGAGVVVAFGLLLLGLKIANRAGGADGTHAAGSRAIGLTMSILCAIVVIGVVVVGVYAMTQKPSSSPAKPKSALIIRARPQTELIAFSR